MIAELAHVHGYAADLGLGQAQLRGQRHQFHRHCADEREGRGRRVGAHRQSVTGPRGGSPSATSRGRASRSTSSRKGFGRTGRETGAGAQRDRGRARYGRRRRTAATRARAASCSPPAARHPPAVSRRAHDRGGVGRERVRRPRSPRQPATRTGPSPPRRRALISAPREQRANLDAPPRRSRRGDTPDRAERGQRGTAPTLQPSAPTRTHSRPERARLRRSRLRTPIAPVRSSCTRASRCCTAR